MIIARIFDVSLHGQNIRRVYFVGQEFDAETVRKFLIERNADKDIQVKQIRERKLK